MKVSKEGEQLWHCLMVRVFSPGNDGALTKRFVAGPGKGYSSEAIDKLLDAIAEDIDRGRPDDDYELVQVASNRFNFVWRGKRASDAIQEPAKT